MAMRSPPPTFRGALPLIALVLSILQAHQILVSSFAVGGYALKIRRSVSQVPTQKVRRRTPIHASASEADEKVDRLLELVDVEEVDTEANGQEIQSVVLSLEQVTDPTDTNFTALLGNYNVTHVIPSKPDEKPVGGKWSRGPVQALLKTRRTLQHLLTPKHSGSVAEAVNVITLSALRDSFRIHVILRGDAYELTEQERDNIVEERETPGGLSPRTVRADFDPPRIVLARQNSSLLNLSVGPPSSVVLDTPYCDGRVRVGKGSRGSWFVFKRCYDDEADEWRAWIAQRPVRKATALAVLGGCFGIGIAGCNAKGIWRVGGVALSAVSFVAGTMIGFSSGGIEQGGNNTLSRTD